MRSTIKKHSDFMTGDDAPTFVTPLFIAKTKPAATGSDARYGLVATRRTFRHAVGRNRAKRLLRVWIRECESLMRIDTDYVFIARAPILDAALPDGIKQMTRALKKLSATSNQ